MSKSSIQSYFPLRKLICKIVFEINKSLFPRIEDQSMNKNYFRSFIGFHSSSTFLSTTPPTYPRASPSARARPWMGRPRPRS